MSRQHAIALYYPENVEAPVIIAKGKNELAAKMLEIAQNCGIQIVSDPLLADILSESELGSCIPAETYEAIASIFAFLEKGLKEEWFIKS